MRKSRTTALIAGYIGIVSTAHASPQLLAICPEAKWSGVMYHREIGGNIFKVSETNISYNKAIYLIDHDAGRAFVQYGNHQINAMITNSRYDQISVSYLFEEVSYMDTVFFDGTVLNTYSKASVGAAPAAFAFASQCEVDESVFR
ncbi:hypothetical protein [Aliihoeflea sp. 40Bstr573]|uniref:hypothetical protein n=1 Tax=Aliihoeflea sp. 40Bstr573 TaxID=2696467 RepID=UPI002094B120|nr:hypothetical protein [Aliihoeflea sp. 40Bstr573]MCO6389391.1 hypothetical protein [Aliihoeflea sp. 40Bstr573]